MLVRDGHIIGGTPLIREDQVMATASGGGGGDLLLLETGGTDNLLLETGDNLLLEA